MLHRSKNLVVIPVLALALSACSGGSQSNTNQSPSENSSTNVSVVSNKSNSSAGIAIAGVKNINQVKFKTPSGKTVYGYFDAINNSTANGLKVAKTAPVVMTGWATLPTKGKVADLVIITLADNKTVVATAPVKGARPDVGKSLKNPTYNNSGWTATAKAAQLPPGKVTLKAWAYDSATKEAYPLNAIKEVVIVE